MLAYAAVSILFLAALSLSFFATPGEAAPSWSIQTVSNQTAWAGGNCPIIVDSNGTAHIAYMTFSNQTNSLNYASNNSPVWVSQTIDMGNLSKVFSLVLDANGNPHILYDAAPVLGSANSLKLASYDGGNWNVQNTGIYSDEATLEFDHLGNPHIAFILGGSTLNYANWTGTAWNIETADNSTTDTFRGISLAFDSLNSPFILYNSSSAIFGSRYLRLAYVFDSQWSNQVLSLSFPADSYGNLAADSKDYRHVVFAESNMISYASFYRSYYDSQIVAFNVSVDSVGGLCFDSQDNPHFCYTTRNRELVYAAYSNGTWNIQTVDSGSAFGRSYLALDGSGNPHISYRTNSTSPNTANLMYAAGTMQVPESFSLAIVTAAGAAVTSALAVSYVWKKRIHRANAL
jgi:hypothetical protein